MHILILFGSSTGNTEELAKTVAQVANSKEVTTDLVNVAEVANLDYGKYDFLFLGTSTWDE